MPPPLVAVVGNLSRDVVDGAPPRVGGGPYHAARALRLLPSPSTVVTRCSEDALLGPLVALGVPVRRLPAHSTATFSIRYDGDRRAMIVEALGDAWTPEDAATLADVRFVHVAPLARSDFPPETLAALARGRRLSLDGQGLVRPGRTGPLELDADYDPELLRHVSILKLAEEEAEMVGDPDRLGVPEVVVTLGRRGSVVHADGRSVHVPTWPLDLDNPTGAGDGYAAAYLAARAAGHAPVSAARRATAVAVAVLSASC